MTSEYVYPVLNSNLAEITSKKSSQSIVSSGLDPKIKPILEK
jgi:hypothetical protein